MKLGIILVLASAGIADPVSITGRASIVDGDTIEIQGRRVRLNGVDAPETRQLCKDEKGKSYRCGKIAADALDGFLASSRPTTCRMLGNDRYRRLVGSCYRADGPKLPLGWCATVMHLTGHSTPKGPMPQRKQQQRITVPVFGEVHSPPPLAMAEGKPPLAGSSHFLYHTLSS